MPKNKKKLDESLNPRLQKTPIAIIGMSSLFPQSANLEEYWNNIIGEVDCITEVPPDRWSIEDYYDPDPTVPDKTYCKKGGFIPDIDFDPMEFGLPPNILEVTDVSQLLCLVLAKQALKDGGYEDTTPEIRENTGAIIGVGGGQKLITPLTARLQYPIWKRVLKSRGIEDKEIEKIIDKIKKAYVGWEENSFPGTLGNIISGRITNRLDLGGTNCVVDAACASSLSGMRMAISDLLEHRSDMMLTGGVDTDNSIYMYMCFSKTPALTRKEINQPFDAESAGIMIGEGVGMLLLKRLEDAQRDGDRIYAVIKGTGSSSDGKFKSIYAPRSSGQVLALKRAYENAGVPPSTISMIEAHGTGTKAGDAAEVQALNDFIADEKITTPIALASVKSQIGHTKNAAGAAGIIKVALSLYHKVIPATINIQTPNPEFKLEQSSLYLNTKTRPWIKGEGDAPRRAGISAFGFGGTNFHFVLEEHGSLPDGQFRIQNVPQSLLLTADNPQLLEKKCIELLGRLKSESGRQVFYEVSKESETCLPTKNEARMGWVAKDCSHAITLLTKGIETLQTKKEDNSWELPDGIYFRSHSLETTGKVVALFSGQGSPYLNMGKELVYNFPPLLECYSKMDGLFAKDGLEGLSRTVFPEPTFEKEEQLKQEKKLMRTELAQPAIGVFSAGQYKILSQAGFKADFCAGHSFGELTALWAAGVLSESGYLALAKARGAAMAAPSDPDFDAGCMLAVVGKVDKVSAELEAFPEVCIANFNSNKQIVLAGPKKDIEEVQKVLKTKRLTTVLLGVSAAFHTPMVGHAQKPFAKAIKKTEFKTASCPIYSNETALPYPDDPKAIPGILEKHMFKSVQFTQQIENIHNDGGYFFIEFGPQQILTKLVSNILKGKPHMTIALNGDAKKDSDYQLRQAVIRLKVAGLSIGNIDPYQKPRTFVEKKAGKITVRLSASNYVSDATQNIYEESLKESPMKQVSPQTQTIEKHHQVQPQTTAPVPSTTPDLHHALESVERGLSAFHSHQNETLSIHEKFLNTQSEYSSGFFNLMQQLTSVPTSEGRDQLFQGVSENMDRFHQHQEETLRVHEHYLQHQAEYAQSAFHMVKQQHALLTGGELSEVSTAYVRTAPPARQSPPPLVNKPRPVVRSVPIAQPAPFAPPVAVNAAPEEKKPSSSVKSASSGTSTNSASIQKALMEVVSEKTGYVQEMLELSMDMEADLGIDSIKRVEILYGIQEKLPDLPQVNPEELSELRTLQEIIDYMKGQSTVAEEVPSSTTVAPSPANSGVNVEQIRSALLKVVSEKTGYLEDMLDFNMDMESDLGIDSIKRVEILYGVQEAVPDLPQVNPEELSELRTLEQIIEHMAAQIPGEEALEKETTSTASISSQLQPALFEVVSEKTGYLVDMLEASMDLEADLGIDSIKRVEILYAIQEKIHDLPQINPEDLSELRTLGQIIEFMDSQSSSSVTPPQTTSVEEPLSSEVDNDRVSKALFEVVSEKTGYLVEMLDATMDLEADLGIDSIKRVEILYGVQEKIPDLPQVNPEDLSELRTLGQIIEQMNRVGTLKKKT